MTIDQLTKEVVQDFVSCSVLFTALDVSNKVKEKMPFIRHRECRDAVRNMFVSDIEPMGYARTSIAVTLSDGTTTEALLYHPLVDSWDLDNKYSAQQRIAGQKPLMQTPVQQSTVQQSTVVQSQVVAQSTPLPAKSFTPPSQPAVPQRV